MRARPRPMAHPERQLIFRGNGSIELHVLTEDGWLWGAVDFGRAVYLERQGVPVCVIGNGLLALGFPGCTTTAAKCQCRKVA